MTEDEPIKKGRPNVVVLAVGLSGSSLVVAMMEALGWKGNRPDPRFHELPWVSEVNDRLLRGEVFPEGKVAAKLSALRQPWVLKDPRFVRTLHEWLPSISPYHPALLCLDRDPAAVVESYRKREMLVDGRPGLYGRTVDELIADAAEQARRWPGHTMRLGYEAVCAAAKIARECGHSRGAGGLWT